MASLTFKRQHRINHMFKHAWSGNRSVFGDMPYQHQCRSTLFGKTDQFLRRCAHLADGARGAFNQIAVHRLNRVNHQQGWRRALSHGGQYVADRGCRRQLHRRIAEPKPPCAQTHLVDSLFTRNIRNAQPTPRQIGRRLQQQSRLTDTRITAQQRR